MIKKCRGCGQSDKADSELASCQYCFQPMGYWCEEHSSGMAGWLPGPACPACIPKPKKQAKKKELAPPPPPPPPRRLPPPPPPPPPIGVPLVWKFAAIAAAVLLGFLLIANHHTEGSPTQPIQAPPKVTTLDSPPPPILVVPENPQIVLPDLPSEDQPEERIRALEEALEGALTSGRPGEARMAHELLGAMDGPKAASYQTRLEELTTSAQEAERRLKVTELVATMNNHLSHAEVESANEAFTALNALDPTMAEGIRPKFQKALQDAEEQRRLAPAEGMVREADQLLEQGKRKEAEKIFSVLGKLYGPTWKFPRSGRLKIHLLGANHLPKVSVLLVGKATPDPYLTVRQGTLLLYRSQPQSSCEPGWLGSIRLDTTVAEPIMFKVFDHRMLGSDDLMLAIQLPRTLNLGIQRLTVGDKTLEIAVLPDGSLWTPGIDTMGKKRGPSH